MKTSKPEAALSSQIAESRVKVRYAETDQMGVAYYANYFVWFEVGRSQYCNDCGFSYRDMERETKLFLIVAEANCRYKNPARPHPARRVVRVTPIDGPDPAREPQP